jgi:hypothetical protein
MSVPQYWRWLPLNLALVCYAAGSAGGEGNVTGNLVQARGTGESIPAALVTVSFRNDSATTMSIRAYRLHWPGGAFSADPKGLRIPAHSSIERKIRLDAINGDIAALLDQPQQVKIELDWARFD